jgi:hypothetical protein
MNTIGKIQASLASATQETTLALANANFDFSLVKIEAPAEYRELGLALHEKKRSEAENGSVHITAQRLGSLFHSILPETPVCLPRLTRTWAYVKDFRCFNANCNH